MGPPELASSASSAPSWDNPSDCWKRCREDAILSRVDLTCPSLGDFKDVPVIEVLVKVGEQIELDTPLVTLETDKATMDVPSTVAGRVVQLLIEKGGRVSQGTPLVRIESADSSPAN